MRAFCVNPANVHIIWPAISQYIKSAMEEGDFSDFSAVEKNVLAGNSLLWLAADISVHAAAVTELSMANDRRLCFIVACGGHELKSWLPLKEKLERYAWDEKCDAMKIVGRKGWERVLPDYRASNVILTKELH